MPIDIITLKQELEEGKYSPLKADGLVKKALKSLGENETGSAEDIYLALQKDYAKLLRLCNSPDKDKKQSINLENLKEYFGIYNNELSDFESEVKNLVDTGKFKNKFRKAIQKDKDKVITAYYTALHNIAQTIRNIEYQKKFKEQYIRDVENNFKKDLIQFNIDVSQTTRPYNNAMNYIYSETLKIRNLTPKELKNYKRI